MLGPFGSSAMLEIRHGVRGGAESKPVEPDLAGTSEGMLGMSTESDSPSTPALPRVLSIAGTDPTGGAGTAADTKSITAAGGYAMCVTTALVAQNTCGVREVHAPPASFLVAQLAAVADDVVVDAVKTGMLGDRATIETVGDWLAAQAIPIRVVDPVMVAQSGHRLLAREAEQAMRDFCARASVVTPNIGELAVLLDESAAEDCEQALAQGQRYSDTTGVSVIVKTGHLNARSTSNYWVAPGQPPVSVAATRVATSSTHGTGCSLSSALATRLASGETPTQALTWTTEWLHEAILHGAELAVGTGSGPVDHGHRMRRLLAERGCQ